MNENQLFEVDVDTLLGNEKNETPSIQDEVSLGKMPWIFGCCLFIEFYYKHSNENMGLLFWGIRSVTICLLILLWVLP
jgi:hypothetical protein